MMALFDRLNRRLLTRLRRDAPRMIVEEDAIRLTTPDGISKRLTFVTLTAARVLHRDVYAADAILLHLAFATGDCVEIFQDDPQWEALVAALDSSGRTNAMSDAWQLQSIADGPDAPPRELVDR